MRRIFLSLAGAVLLAGAAAAQPSGPPPGPPPAFTQVRGTVLSLDGQKLTVATREGPTSAINLSADWSVNLLKNVDLGSIQPGSFIGTTEMEKPDGTGVSREVHVFPPGVKAGEGHYPWPGGGEGAMMTNGDVSGVVAGAGGRWVDITYPGGKRHVFVGPDTPIVAFSTGDRAAIKPGVPVFVLAVKADDGSYNANGVSIGENGKAPPM
jgi:hypothetical protein